VIPVQSIPGEIDRKEPPKFGGKGTFSSISAVAAAAGHINPLLNSSPSHIDGGLAKPYAASSHPGFTGNGSTNGNQSTGQSMGSSEEIRLPVNGIALHSTEMSASNALKGVNQHPIAQKGAASQKGGEVKPLRVNLSKTQRDKFKDKKLKEEPEKQGKEQETVKIEDRTVYPDKERDSMRQQPSATVLPEVLTYENLKLGDIATLSKMREITAAKLLVLEQKAMLVTIVDIYLFFIIEILLL
jgi:hypothetical protein